MQHILVKKKYAEKNHIPLVEHKQHGRGSWKANCILAWSHYLLGLHMPQPTLHQQANMLCIGTSDENRKD